MIGLICRIVRTPRVAFFRPKRTRIQFFSAVHSLPIKFVHFFVLILTIQSVYHTFVPVFSSTDKYKTARRRHFGFCVCVDCKPR